MPTQLIPLQLIDPPTNPDRFALQIADVQTLADDIRLHGLIQPIVLGARNGRYEVVAGHRRFLAVQSIGWTEIEARVLQDGSFDAAEIRFVENTHRSNLTPIEEAVAIRRMQEREGITQEQIAEKVSRSADWVKRRIALLRLDDDFMQAVHEERIPASVALELNRIDDPTIRRYTFDQCMSYGITLDAAKTIATNYLAGQIIAGISDVQAAAENFKVSPTRHKIHCHACNRPYGLDVLRTAFLCPDDFEAIQGATANIPTPSLDKSPSPEHA